MEELRDATVQLRKVLIGYENEEATFRNYERLKGKNVNGIDRRTNGMTFKCGCLYIPILTTSEEEVLMLDEIGFDEEVDRADLQWLFPSGHTMIPLGHREHEQIRPVAGYAFRLGVDRGKALTLQRRSLRIMVSERIRTVRAEVERPEATSKERREWKDGKDVETATTGLKIE